jgi:PIN domain nuclease of toxin-antitoxin system
VRLLLDTHAMYWYIEDDPQLSPTPGWNWPIARAVVVVEVRPGGEGLAV